MRQTNYTGEGPFIYIDKPIQFYKRKQIETKMLHF